jgi:hypothetical protein
MNVNVGEVDSSGESGGVIDPASLNSLPPPANKKAAPATNGKPGKKLDPSEVRF